MPYSSGLISLFTFGWLVVMIISSSSSFDFPSTITLAVPEVYFDVVSTTWVYLIAGGPLFADAGLIYAYAGYYGYGGGGY